MNRLPGLSRVIVLMVAGVALTAPGSDTSTEGDNNNGFPFNLGHFLDIPSMRFQEVYAASNFSSLRGPVTITALDFRPDVSFGGAFPPR